MSDGTDPRAGNAGVRRDVDGAERTVLEVLDSVAADYEIRRRLHAVPPHAVYEVVVDGRRAVCKVARGPEADPATEGRLLAYVGRETSVPVPRVLDVAEDGFVAAWRDDLPAEPTVDDARVRAMGAGLATLHEETAFDATGHFAAGDGDLLLDRDDAWPETLAALLADCREFLERFGYAGIATAVREFLREHPEALAGAGDPVLVHGNYLADHVGVADGEVSCVIDFEHALAGDGEYDFWATAIPTFDNPAPESDEEQYAAFREAYESVRPLPAGFERRAAVYRLVLGVTYLRSLYLQREWETRAEADRRAARLAEVVRADLDRVRSRFE